MLNQTQLRTSLIIFNAFLVLSYACSYHIHPYRSYWNDVLVILGLISLILWWVRVPVITLKIPHAVIVPFGLIVVIAIQTWSQFILYPADMIFPVLYLICFSLALVVGSTIAMHEYGLSILCSVFAAGSVVAGLTSVLLQHLQLLNLELFPWVVALNWAAPLRPYANFAQANTLALTLCFAIASVWYLFMSHKIKPVVALIMALVLLWGLALTQSRIGWIIMPLFLLLFWSEARKSGTTMQPVLVLCAGAFAGFIVLVPQFLHLIGAIAESVQFRAGQTGARRVLWEQALAMSTSHPWFGVGWFQFGPNQVLTANRFNPTEYSDYAHNILFNFAAETGWPVTLLLVAGSVIWLYQCCWLQWKNPQVRFISFIFVAILVHSMVEFPLWYAFFLIPFGLMVGALHTPKLGMETRQIGRFWVVSMAAVSLACMVLINQDYFRMARGFSAIAKIQAGDKRYLPNIQKPDWTLFPQYYDYFHIVEITAEPGMPAKDLLFLERLSMRFGFAPILDRLAIAYSNNHRPTEALQVLTIIEHIDRPEYAGIYAEWSGYAQKNPQRYDAIFSQMIRPVSE